jgi:hypothetical protein
VDSSSDGGRAKLPVRNAVSPNSPSGRTIRRGASPSHSKIITQSVTTARAPHRSNRGSCTPSLGRVWPHWGAGGGPPITGMRGRQPHRPQLLRIPQRLRLWQAIDALLHREHTSYREIGHRSVAFVLERAGIPYTLDQVHDLVAHIERLRPFPEGPEALARLQTRYRLVVLSNGDPDILETAKRYHGIPFDRVISVAVSRRRHCARRQSPKIRSSERCSNPNSRMRLRASVANPFPQCVNMFRLRIKQ